MAINITKKRRFGAMEDDDIIERHEEIIATLTAGKGNAWDKIITELLELERELTLREDF